MTTADIQAVIYTRVSSKAQLKKGDGLASQESRCRDFAAYKGYNVMQVFQDEGVSGGIVDRPAIKSMLGWLRKHRNSEPVVIIDDISRLARGLDAHLKLRTAIGSVGAKLESPSLEFGEDSHSQLIENVLASVSQHHRQSNAEQVRHRMAARLKGGYFCFSAPVGYTYVKGQSGGKVLERDEPTANLLQEALEGCASGRFSSQADVKRFLEPHPTFARDTKGAIHPQRIHNLLTNKLYAGYYSHKPWNIGLTRGNHPALISWETFQRIQTRIAEKSPNAQKKTTTEDFPLRGMAACATCNHPMTGYWAKGRNKRYPYYECFQKTCADRRKSIKRQDIETGFEALLCAMRPSRGIMAMATPMFRDIWDSRITTLDQHRKAQKSELTRIDGDIRKAADLLIATDSAATMRAIEAKIEKLETQRSLITEDLSKSKPKTTDFDGSFRTAMNFLANPWKPRKPLKTLGNR